MAASGESQNAQRERLSAAIAALDAQRATLGDAVVDALLAPARAELAALQAAEAAGAAQTLRQVSILFLDVVGSTALSQHLDPEDTSALMDGVLARASAVVQSHGGRVLQYAGDNLLAAFGADAAREDDAERAVRCGLALCELGRTVADEVRRAHGRDGFHVRVGVHTGDVLLGGGVNDDGTIRGRNVNIAARMEQSAPPGGLRISHDTQALVRGRFELQPQEPLQVKGVDAPIRSYLVQRALPRALARERRGIDGVATRMIGRDAELEALREAHRRAAEAGGLELVSVVAEAGHGKSRLLEEFMRGVGAQDESVTLLRGRALPQTQTRAYGLLHDIVATHWRIADDDPPDVGRAKIERGIAELYADDADARDVEARAHLIGHLIGIEGRDSPHLQGILHDAQQIRGRAFYATAQVFRRLTERQRGAPVVLALEDLHWADDPSLDFLATLVDVDHDVPLFIVATTRPTLAERRPDWASEQPPRRHIALQPLDARASRDLAHELLQRLPEVPAALRELLTQGAEGNPFYMEELVRMLIDQGALVAGNANDDAWRLNAERLEVTSVPTTLTGVLQARLDGLPAPEKRCLQQASIVGPMFSERELAALDERALEALPVLQQRGLLVPRAEASGERGHAFKHALLHQVVYGTVLKASRRDWHGRLARWLTAQAESGALRADDVMAMTAHHHELAGDALEAARCHAGAAGRAAARYAHAAVFDHVARGLSLLDGLAAKEAPESAALQCRWRLLHVRIRTFERLGQRDGQRADHEAMAALAERAGIDQWRAAVASQRAGLAIARADWLQVEAHARESLQWAERSGDAAAQLEAKVQLVLALRGRGQFDDALVLAQQGLADARARGLRTFEHRFLRWLALIHESLGDEVRSGEMELEALQVARETGDRAGQAMGLACEGLIAFFYGDLAQAQRSLEQSIDMKREIGLPSTLAHTLSNLSTVMLARGDAIRALGLARQAIALARKVEARIPEVAAQRMLGEAELALGHEHEAAQAFADALALARSIGSRSRWQAHSGLARCALARDDVADALAQIEPILSHRWADEPVDTNQAPELVALTCHDVLARASDPRAAQWLEQAHVWMMKVAHTIPDDGRRVAHLNAIAHRRRIAQLWAARHAPPS